MHHLATGREIGEDEELLSFRESLSKTMVSDDRHWRRLVAILAPSGAMLILWLSFLTLTFYPGEDEGYFESPQRAVRSLGWSGVQVLTPFTLGLFSSWVVVGRRACGSEPSDVVVGLVGFGVSLPSVVGTVVVTLELGSFADSAYEWNRLVGWTVWGAPFVLAGLLSGLAAHWISQTYCRLSRVSECHDQN